MSTTKITLEMPEALFRKAKATAASRGQTLKQLVTGALERELRVTARAKTYDCAAVIRSVRQLAKANAADWVAGLDSVGAVRAQRRG
ncbi:MAG: hypothetical protein WCH32_17155 [Pseudomonadota bacterium]